MSNGRIRDLIEEERQQRGTREPSTAGEPTPGDRITLYHRRPKGFGDGRTVEGALLETDEETITIETDRGTKLGVRSDDVTAWEWQSTSSRQSRNSSGQRKMARRR